MKRGVGILLVLVVGLVVFSFISQYTGATAYGYSGSGYSSGRFFAERSEEETTRIEIVSPDSPDIVNENGRYVVRQGQVVHFEIYPNKDGIWDDKVDFRNAISGLKVDSIGDICKIGFELNPGESDSGSNCYTPRKASFRVPYDRRPALYVITACPSSVPTNNCVNNRVYSDKILVVKSSPGDVERSTTFYQGQTGPSY
ncbi:MAG: hypothetical protein ABIB47_04740 [Candidatus Woesearchaeota archaeon]